MSISSLLTFPHPVLTPIVGRPNNGNIQTLQLQLYHNARSIASDRGDGLNGHLALIQPEADYLLRTNGIPFPIPVHPGVIPPQPNGTTAALLFEVKRRHEDEMTAFQLYHAVRNALVSQITTAVDHTYLAALADVNFGFSDVLPSAMLNHLRTTYGILTGAEIEENRNRLSEPWDIASPIESLWTKITEIRRVATAGQQPITDAGTIALLLPMFLATGVFGPSVDLWHSKEPGEQTYDNFMTHFTRANKNRIHTLTTADVKYSNSSAVPVTPTKPIKTATVTVQDTTMYYCWTHGLGLNAKHTSATCLRPGKGHVSTADFHTRHDGSTTFHTRDESSTKK